MPSVDLEDEESTVPKAVTFSLDSFDLVSGALQWAGGNGVVVVCEYSAPVGAQSFGEIDEHLVARCFSFPDPDEAVSGKSGISRLGHEVLRAEAGVQPLGDSLMRSKDVS